MSDVPPVTTAPAVAASWNPARPNSRAMSVKISSTRGWMISERTWRESWRGFRPPTDGTSTVSSAGTRAVSAHPYRFFRSSAAGNGVRRPIAMSFEMWSPPSGRMTVCQIAPLRKSATSVVPPPMSTTTTPSSFSSSYSTASRGERLEDDVVHGEARAVHRADDVLDRGHRGGDDVHLDLEAHARHPDGIADPVAVVHDEVLRQ